MPDHPTRQDPIEVVAYDPRWPTQFEEQAAVVTAALRRHLVRPVEHIGSTAVPGLPAKPIIDMLAVVRDRSALDLSLTTLARAGWVSAPEPGDVSARKHSWCYPTIEHRTHHLHVVEPTWGWPDIVIFRDHLRTHPDVARDYADLKRQLAAADQHDRPRYRSGKASFIQAVVEIARTRP